MSGIDVFSFWLDLKMYINTAT